MSLAVEKNGWVTTCATAILISTEQVTTNGMYYDPLRLFMLLRWNGTAWQLAILVSFFFFFFFFSNINFLTLPFDFNTENECPIFVHNVIMKFRCPFIMNCFFLHFPTSFSNRKRKNGKLLYQYFFINCLWR